ncbi:MAG: OmpA family protein [Pseudomonadota bacterium]
MDVTPPRSATMPRRVFLAAGLSALVAGSASVLAVLGGFTAVASDSFRFSRGTALASGEEARLRGVLALALPDTRIHVTILGHTGDAGDAAANQALSEDRAAYVAAIAEEMGIEPDRITATGIGGGAPLSQDSGETDRAHQARLARVEVTLQQRR